MGKSSILRECYQGDWADWVEAGGDQVQAQRAVPRRPRVRQSTHVTARTGNHCLCSLCLGSYLVY